jgi:hypothetical protein
MDMVPPLPNLGISFNKEDIFYVLLRLYRMMNDADPFNNFTDDEEGESVDFEEDQDAEVGEVEETEPPPPDYFQKLYAAQDNFVVAVVNDYISLFALLSSPLDADPALKKEFIAYAARHGEDIEFTNDKVLPPAPKLFIVPSPKDDPNGNGKKPPKK